MSRRAITPDPEYESNSRRPFDTPKRSKLFAMVDVVRDLDLVHSDGRPVSKAELFDRAGYSKQRGWEVLKERSDGHEHNRRHHNDPKFDEHRGRPTKLTPEEIQDVEDKLEEHTTWARSMSWDQLAEETVSHVSGRTLKRHMQVMGYHKCIACSRQWIHDDIAKERKDICQIWLDKRPLPTDWHNVRFSDEVHYGRGLKEKPLIIRKPGERYCKDCIYRPHLPEDDIDQKSKRYHSWAAAGFKFKSDMVIYDTGNAYGKMNQKTYINQILEPIIKPWTEKAYLRKYPDWLLEEDRDSSHTAKDVVKWKKQNKIEDRYYLNLPHSPDIAPIENLWRPAKAPLKRHPHWDDFETRELIKEGWYCVKQEYINAVVESMPKRLADVVASDGQFTAVEKLDYDDFPEDREQDPRRRYTSR